MSKLIEEKFNGLNLELKNENKTQNASYGGLLEKFEKSFSEIAQKSKTVTLSIEDEIMTMTGNFNKEANILLSKLENEKQQIENNQIGVEDMINDVINRIVTEIQNEKRERESSEETILIMLKNACNKIQKLNE